MSKVEKYIKAELTDLDVPTNSRAWQLVFDNALAASEVLTRKELKTYIAEYTETLPNTLFY